MELTISYNLKALRELRLVNNREPAFTLDIKLTALCILFFTKLPIYNLKAQALLISPKRLWVPDLIIVEPRVLPLIIWINHAVA